MGELHLDIIVDRMKREFKVEANIGAPQVAYRETITKPVAESITPTRSNLVVRGQFGRVKIDFGEPLEAGAGFEFSNTKLLVVWFRGIYPRC